MTADIDTPLSVVALLCRTSERDDGTVAGARALAIELAERAGVEPRIVGSPLPARSDAWEDDLRGSRGCLLEAGGQLSDALRAGRRLLLTAPDCSIALTTLPELARERPDALVLWLDAHSDFHSPESTRSHYLGGMCLAGACGVWDPGLADVPGIDPGHVIMAGVRDIDPGELPLLALHGVQRATDLDELVEVIEGRELFVHVDLDVLDPIVLPGATYPADDGMVDDELEDVIEVVCAECGSLVGAEITNMSAPEHVVPIADLLAPFLTA